MEKPRTSPKPAVDLSETAPPEPAASLDHTQPFDGQAAKPPDKLDRTQAFDEAEHAANLDATVAPPPEPAGNDATAVFQNEAPAKPAPKAAAPKSAEKVVQLGDYKLLKKLGEGGMGAVYQAEHLKLKRTVAVKILAKHLANNPAYVQRFLREAQVMAKLDHPNVLRCYDVGEDKGYHYLAIEFVEGGSLEGWLKKLGKFTVGDALCAVIAASHGLHHAHELTVTHRDVKPDNILLTKNGVIKVADLGLAKPQDEDMKLTQTGTGAGTPVYMSPEQFKDAKHVDLRTDIYALGCMLYAFLTGHPPFKGDTYVEMFEAKERGRFDPVRKYNSDVPERLDLFIAKALDKKPDNRYKTCAEFIVDLESLGLANEALTFFAVDGKPAMAASQGARTAIPGQPTSPARPGAKAAAAAKAGTPSGSALEPPAPPTTYWVRYKGKSGGKITREMSKGQILALIKTDKFDPAMEVSPNEDGPFRALATWREFEPAMRGKMAAAKVEKKAQKYEQMYDKIMEEEKTYKTRRWIRDKIRALFSGLGLLILLAVIGVVGFLLWKFMPTLFDAGAKKLNL